ncbi:MAG: hypothetical protein IH898_01625, partial [Planctomycetes bacterium]|nr:hypothetical protein [Planctomycetota bacterium]
IIESLPDRSRRHRLELSLRRDLGSSMMLTKGFASSAVGEAHARYFELCETYGAHDQIAFALHGLYHYHFVRAEPAQVHTYGSRLLALAKEVNDDYFLAQAHFAIGGAFLMEGQFPQAREYQERSLEIYSRGHHDRFIRDWGYDVGVFCRGFLAHTLWHLGFPDQARATSHEGVALAKAIDHPFSYAVALAYLRDGVVQVGVLGCPELADGVRPDKGGAGSLLVARRTDGTFFRSLDDEAAEWQPLWVSNTTDVTCTRLLRSVEKTHTNTSGIGQLVARLGITADPIPMDSQAKYAVLAAGGGDVILRLLSSSRPEYREKIWDQAAGSILVEEAGGRVSDLNGRPLDFSQGRTLAKNRGVLVTNGHLHTVMLEGLKRIGA